MADFSGAAQALRDAFSSAWGATTPIAEPNDGKPWPPMDPDTGAPVPWVYLEVHGNAGSLRGAGLPSHRPYLDLGHVMVTVFVPDGYGQTDAEQLAVRAGNIFRCNTFYNDDAGSKVVCMSPYPPNAGAVAIANQGDQHGVTIVVPFEFFYFA